MLFGLRNKKNKCLHTHLKACIAPDKEYLPTSFWLNWAFYILNWVFQVFVLGIHLKANKQ